MQEEVKNYKLFCELFKLKESSYNSLRLYEILKGGETTKILNSAD